MSGIRCALLVGVTQAAISVSTVHRIMYLISLVQPRHHQMPHSTQQLFRFKCVSLLCTACVGYDVEEKLFDDMKPNPVFSMPSLLCRILSAGVVVTGNELQGRRFLNHMGSNLDNAALMFCLSYARK